MAGLKFHLVELITYLIVKNNLRNVLTTELKKYHIMTVNTVLVEDQNKTP